MPHGWAAPQVALALAAELPPPSEVIPHRDPFLLLSEVTEVWPGERAVGYWQPDSDATFFAGHFPGRPTVPGVLICESVAQLGAYALLSSPKFSDRLPLFGGIDRVRFRRQVVPGERLDLEVHLERVSARGGRGTGQATVDGQTVCACDLLFVFADRD